MWDLSLCRYRWIELRRRSVRWRLAIGIILYLFGQSLEDFSGVSLPLGRGRRRSVFGPFPWRLGSLTEPILQWAFRLWIGPKRLPNGTFLPV